MTTMVILHQQRFRIARFHHQQQPGDAEPLMPGYEDLLLGRDFITQHGLMVLIDGTDSDNQQRRDQALKAFRPHS